MSVTKEQLSQADSMRRLLESQKYSGVGVLYIHESKIGQFAEEIGVAVECFDYCPREQKGGGTWVRIEVKR